MYFNSQYFYFIDKKNYFSNFSIRNFLISTNDPDDICKAELADSIAVNCINLTLNLKEINGFKNGQKLLFSMKLLIFYASNRKMPRNKRVKNYHLYVYAKINLNPPKFFFFFIVFRDLA